MRSVAESLFRFLIVSWGPVLGSGCFDWNNTGHYLYDPNCNSCRSDGQECSFSINCQRYRICNDPAEDEYDPNAPKGQCLKLGCDADSDCRGSRVCTLERLCRLPLCQVDSDCGPDLPCIQGTCTAPVSPPLITSCEVVARPAVVPVGAGLHPVAVARIHGPAPFIWHSSDSTVAAVLETEVSARAPGRAILTAQIRDGVACTGQMTVDVLAPIGDREARVVVVGEDGAPISGAAVDLYLGSDTRSAITGADGAARFSEIERAIDLVTVRSDDYPRFAVLTPGSRDLRLPLVRDRRIAGVANGIRGAIDISRTRHSDFQMAIAGAALTTNPLAFDPNAITGSDNLPTRIDAPEAGFSNSVVGLPGGFMIRLGTRRFTADNQSRCFGALPGDNEVGCYVVPASVGATAAWAIGGQVFFGRFTGAYNAWTKDHPTEVGPYGAFAAVLFTSRLGHGLDPYRAIRPLPKLCSDPGSCVPNSREFERPVVAIDSPSQLVSIVEIPRLPSSEGKRVKAALVLGMALAEGRGLIPLGGGIGFTTIGGRSTDDGRVVGVDKPFGNWSSSLQDGTVALSMSPKHGGLEESRLALIALAVDPDSLGQADLPSRRVSGLVRWVDRVERSESIPGAFMPLPEGTLDLTARRFDPVDAAGGGVTAFSVELSTSTLSVRIYAPGLQAGRAIDLSRVLPPRAELGGDVTAVVAATRGSAEYADLWTLGSAHPVDRAIESTEAFAIEPCAPAGSRCTLR